MPHYVLALNYWLHLLATVVWIGGLVFMALIVSPGLTRHLGDDARHTDVLGELRRRFKPLANLGLATLLVTGVLQMAADTNYDGFLQLSNAWARAMLLKHIAVGGMVIVGAYMQWSLGPAIERARLLASRHSGEAQLPTLHIRERRLSRLNVTLSILVLLFTALATAQ
jgi:uncharacterized membrane protein